jgi:hypothetical protein
MQKIIIFLIILVNVALATQGESISFGKQKHKTVVDWNCDSKQFNFTILAKGLRNSKQNKKMKKGEIKTVYGLVQDKQDMMLSDSICLIFDINNDGESFYALLVNNTGQFKMLKVNALDWQNTIKTEAKVVISEGNEKWSAKISIPLTDFNCKPGAGDIWRIGFARKTTEKGKDVYYKSTRTQFPLKYGETTKRLGWNSMPLPDHEYSFPAQKAFVRIKSLSRGACDSTALGENVVRFSIKNKLTKSIKLELKICDEQNNVLKKITKTALPEQITGLVEDYTVSSDMKAIDFQVKANSKVIYQSRYPVAKRIACRVYPTNGSFDRKKLIKFSPVISQGRGMTWSQLAGKNRGKRYAEIFGMPWYDGKFYELCRVEKLLPWMIEQRKVHKYNDIKEKIKYIRKAGTKISFTPECWESRAAYWKKLKVYGGYLGDLGDIAAYFESLRRGLKQYKDVNAAFFIGDELYGQMRKKTVHLFNLYKSKGLYPEIIKIDREVREKFGYGKYGIPGSQKDKNRFRWIALKRWANDFTDKFELKVINEVRKIDKNIPILSPDLLGDMTSADISRWQDKRFNIHLAQLNNHIRPNGVNGIAFCRIVNDLSKPQEFWGCTHTEGSGAKLTIEEMQQLYTHFFRNGLTGLHFWPLGGSKLWMSDTRFSRPKAFQYTLDTIKNTLGNRFSVPKKTKAAIYLSELSQMSIPAYWDWIGFIEPAFFMLNTKLNADIQFISDLSVARAYSKPEDYQLIVAPFVQFTNAKAGQKLLDAVKQGTTLLITDPQAFSFFPDGSVPERLRQQLFGTIIPVATAKQMKKCITLQRDFLKDSAELKLDVPPPTLWDMVGKSHTFKNVADGEILMRYSDGSPAAIVRKLGKGKIIITGFNIYQHTSNHPVNWKEVPAENIDLFKALLESCNIKYNITPVIKLPPMKQQAVKKAVCISANALDFRRTLPKQLYNIPCGITYSYLPFPDRKPDIKSSGWISATTGLLTDRLDVVLNNPKKQGHVAWKKSRKVELLINLAGIRTINELNLFIVGELPVAELLGSKEGRTFKLLQTKPASSSRPYVAKISFTNIPGKWKFLKLKLKSQKPLELIEFEVWQ